MLFDYLIIYVLTVLLFENINKKLMNVRLVFFVKYLFFNYL